MVCLLFGVILLGKKIFPNGDIYEGEFLNKRAFGHGKKNTRYYQKVNMFPPSQWTTFLLFLSFLNKVWGSLVTVTIMKVSSNMILLMGEERFSEQKGTHSRQEYLEMAH